MSVKAIQAKVICDSAEKANHLWLTHRIFNESVNFVMRHVFQMRRGERGTEYKQIYDSISSNQDATAKLEAITSLKWKTKKTESTNDKDKWALAAAKQLSEGKLLFDRERDLPHLSSEFRRKVFEMTFQMMSGHDELTKLWEKEHEQWLSDKVKWEAENTDYLKVRPVFDQFETSLTVTVKGSRGRWLLYLDFLNAHPDLAKWRGKAEGVVALTDEERKGFRKPAEHFERFWKKNPELQELDKLHGYYQETFVRPWITAKNVDGFKLRPTFTLPSPEKHPAWYSFKKSASYFNLDITNGTLDLKVITSDDPAGRSAKGRSSYRFLADKRLRRFRDAGRVEKIRRNSYSMLYADPLLGRDRWAEIRGIKLVFRNRQPYFIFSCDIADEPRTKLWKDKKRDFPEGLVTLAVDFGQKFLGAITVCQNVEGQPQQIAFRPAYSIKTDEGNESKPVKAWLAELEGLSFERVRRHEREISAAMSATFGDRNSIRSGGKRKVKSRHSTGGEESMVGLREHLADMKEDRYKKAAHVILETALLNNAKVIVIESLQNYRPMLKRNSRENRNRMTWAVRQISNFLTMEAEPYGIMVFEANPFGTSMFCSACGFVGVRCSRPSNSEWNRFYAKKQGTVPRFIVQRGGDFFCCSNPSCPRRSRMVNADVNASLNLQKRLYDQFKPRVIEDWKSVRDNVQEYLDKVAGVVKPKDDDELAI